MSHDSSKGQRQLRARVRVRVCLHATLVMPSPVLQHSRPAKRVIEHASNFLTLISSIFIVLSYDEDHLDLFVIAASAKEVVGL